MTLPSPLDGIKALDFYMVFSEDYMTVESGYVSWIMTSGDVISYKYGVDTKYFRLLDAACYGDN